MKKLLSILCLCQIFLVGCANTHSKPPNLKNEFVVLRVSNNLMSTFSEVPIGTHKVAHGDVLVSDYPTNKTKDLAQGSAMAGAMFGPIGALAVASANNAQISKATEARIAAVKPMLQLPVKDFVTAYVSEAVSSPAYKNRFGSDDRATATARLFLDLTPALVLTYLDDGHVQASLVIKIALTNVKTNPPMVSWRSRYTSSVDGAKRPMAGPNSWTDEDAKDLKAFLTKNIKLSLDNLLADLVAPAPRDDANLLLVETHVPFMKSRLQLKGNKIAEDQDHLVLAAAASDMHTFSGVHVLDKKLITQQPASQIDPEYTALPAEKNLP
jgi:hypothetical protein